MYPSVIWREETFGCQWCELSVVQQTLLLSMKDQVLTAMTVHLLLQKKTAVVLRPAKVMDTFEHLLHCFSETCQQH